MADHQGGREFVQSAHGDMAIMDRNREFAGKIMLVSGAGSGIGRATAHLLAELGATVAVADIAREAAAATVGELNAHGAQARAFHVDVSDAAAVERLVADIEQQFGGLDGAVNNAAIPGPRVALGDYPLDDWRKVIDVDLNGVFYAMKFEIAALKRRGGGAIVNIGSIASSIGIPLTGPYAAAKHAVLGMTRTAALDHAADAIRINCVGPGYVETPFIMGRGADVIAGYKTKHPMNRLAQVTDIAELVVFLLSARAGFTTGSYYTADGGYTAQ